MEMTVCADFILQLVLSITSEFRDIVTTQMRQLMDLIARLSTTRNAKPRRKLVVFGVQRKIATSII